MNFILDFDWTLFDNAVVKRELEEKGNMKHWRHVETWEHVDPEACLYDDVLSWMKKFPKNDLHILTAYQSLDYSYDAEEFQKVKLRKSGISDYVDSITFMTGNKKDYISTLLRKDDVNVFLDDTLEQLEGVKDMHPEVVCVRMRRPGALYSDETLGRNDIYEVATLFEFDNVLKEVL